MKFILVILTLISLPCPAESVCGFYQVEDFGDRVLYSITRFSAQKTYRGQTTFTITNPGDTMVQNMLRGLCYCVDGQVLEDPEFIGDDSYRLLTIAQVAGRPYVGCMDAKPPGSN